MYLLLLLLLLEMLQELSNRLLLTPVRVGALAGKGLEGFDNTGPGSSMDAVAQKVARVATQTAGGRQGSVVAVRVATTMAGGKAGW